MSDAFCNQCGTREIIGAKFCATCGIQIVKSDEVDDSSIETTTRSQFLNAQKNKLKFIAPIVLIIFLLGSLFFVNPFKSEIDVNKMSASQIMGWLINNNYCTKEDLTSKPKNMRVIPKENKIALRIDDKIKKSYWRDESRLCVTDTKEYPAKSYKTNDWFTASSISIRVGDARTLFNARGDESIFKSPNMVIGKNWILDFATQEVGYDGIYEKTKRDMLRISEILKGTIASNFGPTDVCGSYKFSIENSKWLGNPSAMEKRLFQECEDNFPEYMNLDTTWKD